MGSTRWGCLWSRASWRLQEEGTSLFNLIRNERLKQYKKLSTWILIGIILLFMVLSVCLTKYMYSQNSYSWNHTWQESYASQIQAYQQDEAMKYQAEAYTYLLENNIPPSDWRTNPYQEPESSGRRQRLAGICPVPDR